MTQSIKIIRGTTNTFAITLTDASGNPYVLRTGEKLIFGVKGNPKSANYDIKKELTSADYDAGRYILALTPADTADLFCAQYSYDIGLQSGTNYYNVISCSIFEIAVNVTAMEV